MGQWSGSDRNEEPAKFVGGWSWSLGVRAVSNRDRISKAPSDSHPTLHEVSPKDVPATASPRAILAFHGTYHLNLSKLDHFPQLCISIQATSRDPV